MGCSVVSSSRNFSGLRDEQLVEFARAGSVQATEYLLKKYKGFVEGKARSYFVAGAEPDDVVQEGMIGLYKAIRDFRADRRAHFRSFAELCITRQIITAVKTAKRSKHELLNDCVSLDCAYGQDGDGSCLVDFVADSRVNDPERVLMERRVLRYMRGCAEEDLSRLEQRVFQGYLEGDSYGEMSRSLGCPMKTIDNALQRAKRKVGQRLRELN
jgi:RNA polymerase sporulation-specific sigma factor